MSNLFLFVKHLNKKEGAKKSDSFGLPPFYRLISLPFTSLEIFGNCAATLAPGSTLPRADSRTRTGTDYSAAFWVRCVCVPPYPHEGRFVSLSTLHTYYSTDFWNCQVFLKETFSSFQFECATEEPIWTQNGSQDWTNVQEGRQRKSKEK